MASNINATIPTGTTALSSELRTNLQAAKDEIEALQTQAGQHASNGNHQSIQINDTSADHQYIVAVSELIADRTVTLPLLTGNDEFVFKDHTQTFTNKTLTTPTLTTPTIASFANAGHDHSNAAGGGALANSAVSVVQTAMTQTGAVATGTTVMPFDDTIPQNTEGNEYFTISFTPENASNVLLIDISIILSTSAAADYMSVALFQDSVAGALATTFVYVTGDHPIPVNFSHKMTAGTTSAITFKVRAGTSGAGTTTLNGQTGARIHGGVASSSIKITETSS